MRYLLVLLLLASCSTMGQSLVVTGETLKGVGTEFVQVAAVYKDGCDVTKTIAQADCQRFRSFGEQFQKSFPLAVQLWEAARSANDTAAQNQAAAVISDLASTLSAFAVQVISTYGGK
jgi:hypothetical protein